MMNKPILTPRHIWLQQRVTECIKALALTENISDWEEYRRELKSLADELHYCSTEWEKYYE